MWVGGFAAEQAAEEQDLDELGRISVVFDASEQVSEYLL
jgi:hypothetical protein